MQTTPTGVHLWLIVLKAFHAMNAYSARDVPHAALGESDFRVLEVLLHKGPLPVNTIGPKVFLTPGSISIAVDRLLDRGLVTRKSSTTDRRIRIVGLTAKGRILITRVFENHAKRMEELAQILTPAERTQLAQLLKKLGKHAAEFSSAV